VLWRESSLRRVGVVIFIVVSTGHFDPLLQACARLTQKYDFLGQIGSSTFVPPFPHFRTAPPPEIERHMRESELVISHGGAGMTAMLYRLRKKSVIIPKQTRYGEANQLQVELAQKWGQLGMGVVCLDVNDLEKAIEQCREQNSQFPEFPSLGNHLRQFLSL
jgi:UDP-N-acetylglucosamine transferase subunit ALG13